MSQRPRAASEGSLPALTGRPVFDQPGEGDTELPRSPGSGACPCLGARGAASACVWGPGFLGTLCPAVAPVFSSAGFQSRVPTLPASSAHILHQLTPHGTPPPPVAAAATADLCGRCLGLAPGDPEVRRLLQRVSRPARSWALGARTCTVRAGACPPVHLLAAAW